MTDFIWPPGLEMPPEVAEYNRVAAVTRSQNYWEVDRSDVSAAADAALAAVVRMAQEAEAYRQAEGELREAALEDYNDEKERADKLKSQLAAVTKERDEWEWVARHSVESYGDYGMKRRLRKMSDSYVDEVRARYRAQKETGDERAEGGVPMTAPTESPARDCRGFVDWSAFDCLCSTRSYRPEDNNREFRVNGTTCLDCPDYEPRER